MPAINPSKLQIQIEALLNYFDKPESFHRRLSDLYSFYANRTLHFGQSREPAPIAPKYHLPQPLTRQLHLAIKPQIEKQPKTALECADVLWEDPFFEIKQISIYILGNVHVNEPNQIINRLESWIEPNLDQELKIDLLSTGTNALREDYPSAWERLLQSFLYQKDPKLIDLGIQGLIEGIKRTKFENFPLVFRLTGPIIHNPNTANLEKLENLIATLISQSPTETAFFLKQSLSLSQSAETRRLIKRCLPLLPEIERQDLKASLG